MKAIFFFLGLFFWVDLLAQIGGEFAVDRRSHAICRRRSGTRAVLRD